MSKTQTRTLLLKRGSLNLVMSSSVFAQRVAVSPHFPSFHGRQYDSAEFANLPKTGNLSTLLAAPSMLKPMEKLSELSKQQRTCFKKEDDSAKALLAYQSIPLRGGKSPSELLFGGQIRCTLLCITTSLQPSWPGIGDWKQEKSRRKMKQKLHYDT